MSIRRPRLFSKYEWWYHILMMPVLFPLGNYYFIGPTYFTDSTKFVVGTLIVFGLYWLSIVTLTQTIWWSIRRYPEARHTIRRSLMMLLSVGLLTIGLAIFDVWVYSLVPATGVHFSWEAVRPIWILGLVFDFFLCIMLGLFYSYARWKQEMSESEHQQRLALQHQYDALKGQLNPHFLFNALNSLSVLIGDDPQRAEQFVDKLSLVYRYMLQPEKRGIGDTVKGTGELSTLQAELDFIRLYTDLLQVRYGQSFQIELPDMIDNSFGLYLIPTLSLLTLIDNAMKYNAMSANNPLFIKIDVTDDARVGVKNRRQPRAIRLETGSTTLGALTAKYRLYTEKAVIVEATDAFFCVELPLLTPIGIG